MYKNIIDILKDTPQEIKCKNCGSVDIVFWKDIYERFPHFWQCRTCGGLFNTNMTGTLSIEDLPQDIKIRILKDIER